MYFYRWFLEKVAADTAMATNEGTYLPGNLEMYGGPSDSVIEEQTEGHDYKPEWQSDVKSRIASIKAMFARPDEIAPSIRGDYSHAEAKKSKIASHVGRIIV